ncbi:hypothetical protein T4D_13858 [Trichinella pseudospiralis]|uniref:Uncharacterized protein n=1 Tax=Trichinella pseudospiralis TaxID=6337 RepID=A0A0V1F8K8_TRIPS|nr:hypothetical protein T4D_13858 [Trichinella pseudospiralis]
MEKLNFNQTTKTHRKADLLSLLVSLCDKLFAVVYFAYIFPLFWQQICCTIDFCNAHVNYLFARCLTLKYE